MVIEDSTVTGVSDNRIVGDAINGKLICDGPDPISFTVTHTTGDSQTFTLRNGETCDEPFKFKQLAWVLSSGAASAFRMRAYKV